MQKRNDASHSFLVLSLNIVNSQSFKFRKFRKFITNNFNEQIDRNPLSCEDDVHAVAEAADGNDEHDRSDAAVDVADWETDPVGRGARITRSASASDDGIDEVVGACGFLRGLEPLFCQRGERSCT